MSFRYTSDLEITELESVPIGISGNEAIVVVQDGKTYQVSLNNVVSGLLLASLPVRPEWSDVKSVPTFSGSTVGAFTKGASGTLYNGEATNPTIDLPAGQIQHFADYTFENGANAEVTLPAGDFTGVKVGIRASFAIGDTTLAVRNGSSSGPIIDTLDSHKEHVSVDAAFYFNNGVDWKTFPAPPDALII